jgi:hypothetical protein
MTEVYLCLRTVNLNPICCKATSPASLFHKPSNLALKSEQNPLNQLKIGKSWLKIKKERGSVHIGCVFFCFFFRFLQKAFSSEVFCFFVFSKFWHTRTYIRTVLQYSTSQYLICYEQNACWRFVWCVII